MDKVQKEILMMTKELAAKFIETRTVSPGNFAEIFPAVYKEWSMTPCLPTIDRATKAAGQERERSSAPT